MIQKLLMRPEREGNFNRTKVTTKAIRNIKNLGVTMREKGRDVESRVHCCERKRVTRPCSDTKCRNHGSLSLTRNLPADLKVLGWNSFKGRSSHIFCELWQNEPHVGVNQSVKQRVRTLLHSSRGTILRGKLVLLEARISSFLVSLPSSSSFLLSNLNYSLSSFPKMTREMRVEAWRRSEKFVPYQLLIRE